jgi:hypothetical protein
MTGIVLAIEPSAIRQNSSYRISVPAAEEKNHPVVISQTRPVSPDSRKILLPENGWLPQPASLEPPLRRQAAATYLAQLPQHLFTAVFATPPTRQQSQLPSLTSRTIASAAREYSRQLEMVEFKPGLLVDSYA